MSIRTTDDLKLMDYISKRIDLDHTEVLVIFYNSTTNETIATSIDSDIPEGFDVVGMFRWDITENEIVFINIDS